MATGNTLFKLVCSKCSFRFQIVSTSTGLDLESIEMFVAHGNKVITHSWNDEQPPLTPSAEKESVSMGPNDLDTTL